jgi:hypothetical protein
LGQTRGNTEVTVTHTVCVSFNTASDLSGDATAHNWTRLTCSRWQKHSHTTLRHTACCEHYPHPHSSAHPSHIIYVQHCRCYERRRWSDSHGRDSYSKHIPSHAEVSTVYYATACGLHAHTSYSLSECGIGEVGATALANALTRNTTLRSLW